MIRDLGRIRKRIGWIIEFIWRQEALERWQHLCGVRESLQPNGLAVSCGCPFGFMMPTATDIEADFVGEIVQERLWSKVRCWSAGCSRSVNLVSSSSG
jgi:hypothetical protein